MLKRLLVGSNAVVRHSARSLALLVLIPLIASLSGCGNDTSTGPDYIAPAVASVEVSGPSTSLDAFGETAQYAAVAKDAQGAVIPGKTFVWSSSNPTVAKIESDGRATSAGNGTTTIRAQTGGVSGTTELTVSQQATAVVVSPGTQMLSALGDTIRLAALVTDRNAHEVVGVGPTWLSTDPDVASVNAAGRVTAESEGAALVIASLGSLSDTAQVAVSQAVETLVVSPPSDTLVALGDTVRLNAELRDRNGSVIADATIAWASADGSVATVTSNGLVTAVANGTASVIASAGTASDTALIVVAQAAESILISPTADTLTALGDTVQMSAVVRDRLGAVVEAPTVAWSTTDPSVLSINPEGLVTASGDGTAWIIAVTETVADTAQVHVQQFVASVSISPSVDTLTALEDTLHLAAEARDANGNGIEGQQITWSSLDPGVATADGGGLITASGTGSAKITAAAEGKADTATVWVVQVPESIELDLALDTLAAMGDTVRVSATVRDANGYSINGAQVIWESSASSVASVDAAGLVTAVGEGSATVSAQSGEAAASVVVVVEFVSRIVFASSEGNGELYSILSNGTGLVRLTNTSIGEGSPAVAADGTKIAYTGGVNVYVMNIDGTGSERVTWGGISAAYPSWSPDGDALAINIRSCSGCMTGPHILELATGLLQQLPGGGNNLSWSHGDSLMASEGSYSIDVVGIATGAVNKIVQMSGGATHPRFSPTGDRIVFDGDDIDDGANTPNAYVVDTDGQNLRQITTEYGCRLATWSPDGTKVACSHNGNLAIINVDGTGFRQITSFSGGGNVIASWYN